MLRKPAGRHLVRVRFANETRRGSVGGGVRWGKLVRNDVIRWGGVGAEVWMRRFVSGGNLATDRHRFRPGPWSFDICGDLRKIIGRQRGSREEICG